jgi:competence protein ComEC
VPPVLHLYLALVVGLATGFLLPPARAPAGLLALGLAAAAAALRARRRAAAVLAACAVGAATAWRADRADAACRARIIAGAPVVAMVDAAAVPGARVRATALDPCGIHLHLSVTRGRAPAGAYVRVRGIAWPAGRGLRVPDAAIAATGRRAALPAAREQAGTALDRLFGPDAPLARALVVADARAIAPAVRDRFADAGLVHALSVSGLHVAIVAGALELLLRAARLPASRAALVAALGVAAYVAVIGAPAPAVRAGVMLAAAAAARAAQRPTSPWAVFALGAGAPLVDPRAVLDLGYQLSVAGMAALVAGRQVVSRVRAFGRAPAPLRREPRYRRLARDLAAATRRGWRAHVAGELVVGTFAAVATAPLVAWHFGRVSLAGVVANVAAGPVLGALQPALFLALLLAPIEPAARLAADGVRPMLRALDAVARRRPRCRAAWSVPRRRSPGAAARPPAQVALLAGAAARRRRGQWIVIGAGAVAAAVVLPPSRGGGRSAELHVLDVGQGDAVALRTPRGRWVLFDAGRPGRGADAGARAVIPYLRRRGGELVALVLSHPHADHVGGAPEVIRRLHPTHVWDAGYALGSDTYRDVLAAARAAGARWRRVRPGDSLAVDGVVLRVLAPDPAWTAALDDPNSASVVVSARYGRVRFLLVGDAEAPEEHWLAARARWTPRSRRRCGRTCSRSPTTAAARARPMRSSPAYDRGSPW